MVGRWSRCDRGRADVRPDRRALRPDEHAYDGGQDRAWRRGVAAVAELAALRRLSRGESPGIGAAVTPDRRRRDAMAARREPIVARATRSTLAVTEIAARRTLAVLDVGTGTGKLAAGDPGRLPRPASSVSTSPFGMLRARPARPAALPSADALQLPFADAQFDAVVSAFVMRNLADVAGGIAEQVRVLGLAVRWWSWRPRPDRRICCGRCFGCTFGAGAAAGSADRRRCVGLYLLAGIDAGVPRAAAPGRRAASARPGRRRSPSPGPGQHCGHVRRKAPPATAHRRHRHDLAPPRNAWSPARLAYAGRRAQPNGLASAPADTRRHRTGLMSAMSPAQASPRRAAAASAPSPCGIGRNRLPA